MILDRVDVDVSDLHELAADFTRMAAETGIRASVIVRKNAGRVESTMKDYAPVRTGRLRDSITTTYKGATAEVGPTEDYAVFLEFGTAHMEPQPFVGPAADRHEPQFFDDFDEFVEDI